MKYYFIYSSTIKGRRKVTKISISYFLLNPSTKSKPRYNRLLLEMKKRCRQSWASFDTVFFFLRIFLTYTYKKLLIDRRNVAWSIVEDLSKESRLPFLVSLELEFFLPKKSFYFGWEYHSDIRIRGRDWNKCRSEFLVTLP